MEPRRNLRKRYAKRTSHVDMKVMELYDDLPWHRQVIALKAMELRDGLPCYRQVNFVTRWNRGGT